ncbi:uncharacterized protein LOC121377858 [Gigantopelta aegis]|uniref:uncharacterized protein LOC121377858 n=1 Tax=Gigantopelta aegis TaxID=1735272 RepID=UPI001B889997|nr:uncharacterized protein LOC121377858 [Gigantopelta aegis]
MSVPMMPWGRKLLGVAEEVTSFDNVPLTVVVAAVAAVVIVLLLMLCVCGDSDDKSKLQKVNNHDVEENHGHGLQVENADCVVSTDGDADIRAKSQNGRPGNRNSAGQSRSSQTSTASSQMRPTSLRELPEPPVQNGHPGTVTEDTDDPRQDNGDNDDYDHLLGSKKTPVKRLDNYDHVLLDSICQKVVIPPSEGAARPCENYYTQVHERTYEVVKDATTSKNTGSDDLYTKVKDTNTDHYSSVSEVKEMNDVDPYDLVVDKDPYTKVNGDSNSSKGAAACKQAMNSDLYPNVSDIDPYEKVKDTDPYAKVKDTDPYAKVKDNYPYAKVKESVFDPYAQISDADNLESTVTNDDESCDLDPYSTVDEDPPDNNKTVNVQLLSNVSDGNLSSSSFELLPTGSMSLEFPQISDEYAVVTKLRQSTSVDQPRAAPATADPNAIPEEPPRSYHMNEIHQPSATERNPNAACNVDSEDREYTMVTARESLASMTARNALNPYEIVPDTDGAENMYATVDGSSGDGVIRRNTSDVSATPQIQAGTRSSEMYTEIGGPYNDVDVPAPPSVDSLHLMRRQQNDNRRHLASPEDTGISRSSSDYAVVNKRSSFSPSATKLPEIPHSSSAVMHEGNAGTTSNVTLDPNYQMVKDSLTDMEAENDPNYESVEEARARAPPLPTSATPQRQHHYEQVSPSSRSKSSSSSSPAAASSTQNEAAAIRDRVLSSHTYEDPKETSRDRGGRKHTYEDITEVNEQKKELGLSGDGERERYLYKRKKTSEETKDDEEVTML